MDKSLPEIGGKGLFTEELELALRKEAVDIAVHSAKDLPTTDPEGLCVAAFLEREKPTDCLVSPIKDAFKSIENLPENAILGTSSLRRQAQLLNLRSDLKVTSIRGNVDTRISKMLAGEVQAILLASAGIIRLGFHARTDIHIQHLDENHFLPAVGQGSVAVQCRIEDLATFQILRHTETHLRVLTERELLRRLEGGCSLPLGVKTNYISPDNVHIYARLLSTDGLKSVEAWGEGNHITAVDRLMAQIDSKALSEIRGTLK